MRKRAVLLAIAALSVYVPHLSWAQSGDGGGSGPPPQEDSELGVPGGGPFSTWGGGQGSLPTGEGATPGMLISAALMLPCVQAAMTNAIFGSYVRRPDLDFGASTAGRSTVVIAYQYPGVNQNERQPFLIIVSREDSERIYTQVFATATATGAGDLPIVDEMSSVSSHFYVDRADAAGSQIALNFDPGPLNPVIWSTAYDIKNNTFPSDQTRHFMSSASDCFRQNMGAMMTQVAYGAGAGALAAARNAYRNGDLMELTRFRGHLTIWVGGLHDAQESRTPTTVPA